MVCVLWSHSQDVSVPRVQASTPVIATQSSSTWDSLSSVLLQVPGKKSTILELQDMCEKRWVCGFFFIGHNKMCILLHNSKADGLHSSFVLLPCAPFLALLKQQQVQPPHENQNEQHRYESVNSKALEVRAHRRPCAPNQCHWLVGLQHRCWNTASNQSGTLLCNQCYCLTFPHHLTLTDDTISVLLQIKLKLRFIALSRLICIVYKKKHTVMNNFNLSPFVSVGFLKQHVSAWFL